MNAVTPIALAQAIPLPAQARAPAALWTGSPRWKAATLRIWKTGWIAAYFAVLLADGARIALRPGAPADIWLGEARLAGLALAMLAGLVAMAAMTARTTRYSIDGGGVTLRYGVALPATLVIPFAAIEHVGVRIHRDGTGDVALRLKPGPNVFYPKLWPHARPWRLRRPEPMLRCIPDAGVAATLLSRALSAQAAPV